MLAQRYYKDNLKLAYPIILSSLGQSIVQFFDTLMVGQVGKEPLAAVAFASAIIVVALVFSQGIGMALTPLVGQSYARKETRKVSLLFQNALSLNVIIGTSIVVLLLLLIPVLPHLGQDETVIRLAIPYFITTAISLLPAQIFLSFRHFMEGVGNTKTTMQIIISANILNILLNYIFIFGKLGCPPLGAFGAGLSTLIARCLMPIAYFLYIYFHKHYRKYLLFFSKKSLSTYWHKSLMKLGLPIAIQLTLESISFTMTTIMMGWFSTIVLAAYQIVLTFITMTFQIACGVASATTILVSHCYGRKDKDNLSKYAKTGLHLSFVSMSFFAAIFILFPHHLAEFFNKDPQVIEQAAELFIVAGFFQLLDGAQATLLGALRGFNDVAKPMLYSFISYICIALPTAYILGFTAGLGPCGALAGIATGLLFASIFYYRRLNISINRIK